MPDGFGALIDLLVQASIDYLDGQVQAGADVLQIFDTWAGALSEPEFERWVVAPTRRIVTELKRRHPRVPIIGFPRGAGTKAADYLETTGVDGLGCDTGVPLDEMRALTRRGKAVQGNIDPLLLVAGGAALDARVRETLDAMRGVPFIFNLGHGIVPETPPEHVARLVALVRNPGALSHALAEGVPHHGGDRLARRAVSTCRGCSSTTPTPSPGLSCLRPSRSWSSGFCGSS